MPITNYNNTASEIDQFEDGQINIGSYKQLGGC